MDFSVGRKSHDREDVETVDSFRLFYQRNESNAGHLYIFNRKMNRAFMLPGKLDSTKITLSRHIFILSEFIRNGRDKKLIIRTIITLRYSISRLLI